MALSRKYKEALNDDVHKVGMAALFAGCAFTGMLPLFPFVAVPLEAAYLLLVPDSAWFQKRLKAKTAEEERQRRLHLRNALLPNLRPLDQNRYQVLERTRAEIEQQQPEVSGSWHTDVLGKLDYLLERYLHFGSKAMQYRLYLANLGLSQAQLTGRRSRPARGLPDFSDDPAARFEYARVADAEALVQTVLTTFDSQEDRLAHEMEREKDQDLLEVMRKNAEVLRSSHESIRKIGKILRSVEQQLDLLTNTFTLINTQIRIQSPEKILQEVDQVVDQSEALTQTIEEFAPLEEALSRLERAGVAQ